MFLSRGPGLWISAALISVALAGCGTRMTRAPVEDRGTAIGGGVQPGEVVPSSVPRTLPGSENAGKPGYYTVKPGDTLIRIGLETGQGWKDIARWNGLENPHLIEVGQVVEVNTTDPGSLSDFPAWAKSSGHEIVETEQEKGIIRIFVRRKK